MTRAPRPLLLAALMALGLLAACDTTAGPQPVPDSASRHNYTDRFVPRP